MTDNELLIAAGISDESKRNEILEILNKGNYDIHSFLRILSHDNESLKGLKQFVKKRTIFNCIEEWIYYHIIYYLMCWILYIKNPEYRKHWKEI